MTLQVQQAVDTISLSIFLSISPSLSRARERARALFIYVYMYIYIHIHIYLYTYVYVFPTFGMQSDLGEERDINKCIFLSHHFCLYSHSTEAIPPKSTESRNLNSSVQIQIKPTCQFECVQRDTEKFEYLNLVDFGDAAFQWKLLYMFMQHLARSRIWVKGFLFTCICICICICICMCMCICICICMCIYIYIYTYANAYFTFGKQSDLGEGVPIYMYMFMYMHMYIYMYMYMYMYTCMYTHVCAYPTFGV